MRILAGPHQGGQTRSGRSPTKFTKAIRGEAPPPGQVGARPHQVHESNRGRGPVKLSLDSDPWPQRGRGEAFFRPRNVSGAVRETRGEAPKLNNRLRNQRAVLFDVERNRGYTPTSRPAAGCTPWRRARRDADGGGCEARRGTRIVAGGTAVDHVEPRSRGLAELGPTRMAEGAGASGAKPSSSLPLLCGYRARRR